MENILSSYPKIRPGIILLFIAAAILLSACGGEGGGLKTESYYFNEQNEGWLSNDTLDDTFVMIDNYGISQSFSMNSNNYYFNKSWGSIMGITTHTSLTEYHYQSYRSSFRLNFSLSLTAGIPPFGDNIYANLMEVGFAYDFEFETVPRLDTPFGHKSLLMTSEGYEISEDGEIFSAVEILDSLSTAYASYDQVLHFTFHDFKDFWTDYTVSEIYLAREVGLVKYVLANGDSGERK